MSLTLAKKMALANDEPKWRLGAVIVRSSRVLSVGLNKATNNAYFVDDFKRCSVHAEEKALSLCKNPSRATIYIARVKKGGGYGLAEPCDRCKLQLEWAGIKKAVFTIDGHTYGEWKP